jgi:NTP pyrophosphatase (non-canonical NTP hydrolase)
MPDAIATLAELKEAFRQFVAERQWEKYHSPKNLAVGLAIETAELLEHFQWLDNKASDDAARDPARRPAIVEEVADVACYLLALANVMQLDLADAITAKLEKNRRKYPADEFQGHYERPAGPPSDRALGPRAG